MTPTKLIGKTVEITAYTLHRRFPEHYGDLTNGTRREVVAPPKKFADDKTGVYVQGTKGAVKLFDVEFKVIKNGRFDSE